MGEVGMSVRRGILHGTIIIGLCLVIIACAQTPLSSPQPTPSPTSSRLQPKTSPSPQLTPTQIIASAANVQPAPNHCPPGTPIQVKTLSPAIIALGGISPVWATVRNGGTSHLAGENYDPDGGWPAKIVWEVGPHYTQLVAIRAGNLLTGMLLKWHLPDHYLTTTPVLDPQHPDHPVSVIGSDWNEWGSEVLIPGAGCYYIEADWPTGHWRVTFAAGL